MTPVWNGQRVEVRLLQEVLAVQNIDAHVTRVPALIDGKRAHA